MDNQQAMISSATIKRK